jgi:hypothetical protein
MTFTRRIATLQPPRQPLKAYSARMSFDVDQVAIAGDAQYLISHHLGETA